MSYINSEYVNKKTVKIYVLLLFNIVFSSCKNILNVYGKKNELFHFYFYQLIFEF